MSAVPWCVLDDHPRPPLEILSDPVKCEEYYAQMLTVLLCQRCGERHTIRLPIKAPEFSARCTAFGKLHSFCKQP